MVVLSELKGGRPPAVLVTGGAGGLGGATSSLLAARGWHVFVGDLPGDALERAGTKTGVTAVPLDVTDSASVAAARGQVGAATDGLDAVVNFAGILTVGSLIEIDEEELRRILDINVLGTYRVNKAFFDLIHARRGRIVNISSETGQQTAAPFNGPYAMSKHAVEAYSDALRRELMLLGVTVVTIRPGPFRTDMVGSIEARFTRAAEASEHFGHILRGLRGRLAAEQAKAHPPEDLATVIHHALTTPRPKPGYTVREDRQRALLERLPVRWADAILRKVLSGP